MPFLPEAHSQMSYSISLIAPSLSRRNLYQFQPLFTSLSCSILPLLYLSSCRILNKIVYTTSQMSASVIVSFCLHFPGTFLHSSLLFSNLLPAFCERCDWLPFLTCDRDPGMPLGFDYRAHRSISTSLFRNLHIL